MPKGIALEFEKEFNLDANQLKKNSNQRVNSKMYLASFAKFMFDFKDEKYIKKIIKKIIKKVFKISLSVALYPAKLPGKYRFTL
jgi:hypothetical protein